MPHLNIEIKARCQDPDAMRKVLQQHNADFKGTDHQIDTYFRVPNGRLKFRQGNIENALIHYARDDTSGPKESHVTLYQPQQDPSALKEILTNSLGILVVVEKQREIYFIGNIKFHLDIVQNLGTFVEIEAIDIEGNIGREKLQSQCQEYMNILGITDADLLTHSYSDMLLAIR